jgi:D-alanyl-D-alanine carboxypeptidase
MITPNDCINKYGQPTPNFERAHMGIFVPDPDIHNDIVPLPGKIYMNKDMMDAFNNALVDVYNKDLGKEITEWGGCFMIRMMRGTKVPSIHSWGVAFDINVSTNPMMKKPTLSAGLVKCFTDNGFDWGGNFSPRVDGMHFQLSNI